MKGSAVAYTVRDLAGMIDHSLLVPTLTFDDLEKGCRLAVDYQLRAWHPANYAVQATHGAPRLGAHQHRRPCADQHR